MVNQLTEDIMYPSDDVQIMIHTGYNGLKSYMN